jgi:hypothetical protein
MYSLVDNNFENFVGTDIMSGIQMAIRHYCYLDTKPFHSVKTSALQLTCNICMTFSIGPNVWKVSSRYCANFEDVPLFLTINNILYILFKN